MGAQEGLEGRVEQEEVVVVREKVARVTFKGHAGHLQASRVRMACSVRMLVRSSAWCALRGGAWWCDLTTRGKIYVDLFGCTDPRAPRTI